MARTIEDILRNQLGALFLQNADLMAKNENLKEENEQLKKQIDGLKSKAATATTVV